MILWLYTIIVFSIVTGAQWTKVNIAAFQTAKLFKDYACMDLAHVSISTMTICILKQLNQMT